MDEINEMIERIFQYLKGLKIGSLGSYVLTRGSVYMSLLPVVKVEDAKILEDRKEIIDAAISEMVKDKFLDLKHNEKQENNEFIVPLENSALRLESYEKWLELKEQKEMNRLYKDLLDLDIQVKTNELKNSKKRWLNLIIPALVGSIFTIMVTTIKECQSPQQTIKWQKSTLPILINHDSVIVVKP